MFCCIFLTNILQNRRKRISATLLGDGTRHGHTLSQPAHIVGPPAKCHSKCFRYCIAKKEERKAGGGGGVGDRLESPIETHSMFVVFFCMCCCCCFLRFVGGGVNCWYSLFHWIESERAVQQEGVSVDYVSCIFQWIWSGYFNELSGLSASLGWAIWVYQLPREFRSFNG